MADETKITSPKDIKFPYIDRIMGLPPIGMETDGDYFDSKEFLEASFPVLHITAEYYEWDDVGKPLNVNKLSPTYKFAIIPDSQINYAHTNQYGASGIESDLAQLLRFQTAGEVRQLMKTSSGVLKTNLGKGQEYLDTLLSRLSSVLVEAASRTYFSDQTTAMSSLGMDVTRSIVEGARIDLPDIWQDSRTTQNWTFTIDLRTMATNPNSELYKHDIIQPLEILLKLSLPVGGYNISYLEPPYISAKLGNFLDVKMGGISNIMWTAPLNEFNLNETPRHIEVSLTIQDLYNVIVQSGSENEDFPTLERHISNFTKNYKDKTAGKAYSNIFKNEYKPGNESSNAVAEGPAPYQSNFSRIEYPTVTNAKFNEMEMLDSFDEAQIKTVNMAFNNKSNTFSVYSSALNNAELFKLDNVTNITGNALSYDFLNGKETTTMDIANIKSFNISGMNNIKDMTFSSLMNDTKNSFDNVFTNSNIAQITNGIITEKPVQTLDQLAVLNQMTTQNLNLFLSENNDNLTTLFNISDNIVQSLGSQINGMVLDTTPESLSSATLRRIKYNNPVLENQIRYSREAQRFVEQISDLYTSNFVNNTNIRNEYINYNSMLPPTSYGINTDLITAMSSIFAVASVLMKSNSMNSILSSKLKGVDREITIHLEV